MFQPPEPRGFCVAQGRRLDLLTTLRLLALLLFIPGVSRAQGPEPEDTLEFDREALFSVFREVRAGVMFGPQWRAVDARFSVKPGTDSCGVYDGGSSTTSSFSFFFDVVPEGLPDFWFPFRLSRSDRAMTLHSTERIQPARSPSGELIDVVTENQLEIRGDAFSIAVGAGWIVNDYARLGVAPSLSFQSIDAIRNLESIVRPDEAVFSESGEVTRPFRQGREPAIRSVVPGIDLLASARLEVGPFFALHPELRVGLPLTDVATDVPWRELEIEARVGLSFDLASRALLVDTATAVDSVNTGGKGTALSASIIAYGVDARGERYPNPVIEIEETPWSESVPVIPFVFFDSGAATIPARYALLANTSDASGFHVDSLLSISPIDIHWQMLNVLGRRLRENPETSITLTGSVSGDELMNGGVTLGRQRAEAVGHYLQQVWAIDKGRISTAFTQRSPSASPEDNAEGRGENRRVEIQASDPSLLDPVVIRRIGSVASPPSVRFAPEIVADTAVAEWYISIVQGNRELLRFDGDATMASLRQQKEWSLADLRVTRDLTPIRYRLTVKDVTGQKATAEGSFKVEERARQRQIDTAGRAFEVVEQSLVGFGYNSSSLLADHISQISDLAGGLPGAASVSVVGYTDRVGDAERNLVLSRERAQRVFEQLRLSRLRRGLPELAVQVVDGVGSARELFDNDLPEGRLLSRMVRITVVLPLSSPPRR